MTTLSSRLIPGLATREEALALTVPQKLEYFRSARLLHPRIREVMADLETMAIPGSGTDIALLIGPTGVGKSTVVDGLWKRILQKHEKEMEEDPGFIPAVVVEAPASGERGFSWRMFYDRLGSALREPLMNRKQETTLRDGRTAVRPVAAISTVTGMRMAVENALKARRTSLVVVDEAAHLIRNVHGNTLDNYMDALKSLSNICDVTLTLVGSYDLYQLLDLSGQVARRSAIVHFSRYLTGVPADEDAFRKVVAALQKHLPLENPPDLVPLAGELHENSMGCVGILKDTLARTLSQVLDRDGGRWTEGALEQALLSQDQMESILEETLTGESRIKKAVFGSGSFRSMGLATREVTSKIGGAE
jgi:hypothetical protein